MGLVIGPLILFWFLAMTLSTFMGWKTLGASYYLFAIVLVSVVLGRLYANTVILELKDKKVQWEFEATMHIATREKTIMFFILCTVIYFLLVFFPAEKITGSIIFCLTFASSYGTIHGILKNKEILSKHEIKYSY